jgi:hypothetical protein
LVAFNVDRCAEAPFQVRNVRRRQILQDHRHHERRSFVGRLDHDDRAARWAFVDPLFHPITAAASGCRRSRAIPCTGRTASHGRQRWRPAPLSSSRKSFGLYRSFVVA